MRYKEKSYKGVESVLAWQRDVKQSNNFISIMSIIKCSPLFIYPSFAPPGSANQELFEPRLRTIGRPWRKRTVMVARLAVQYLLIMAIILKALYSSITTGATRAI